MFEVIYTHNNLQLLHVPALVIVMFFIPFFAPRKNFYAPPVLISSLIFFAFNVYHFTHKFIYSHYGIIIVFSYDNFPY